LVLWLNQVTNGFLVNRRKPRVQTPVVSRYPAPAPVDDFVLLFLTPCGPHLTPLATRSLESGLLVSPLLGGPARHRPFAPTLHLHQHKSSRNLHLQYSAKSQSTPRCQSLITARSDHPPVLRRSGPHLARPDPVSARRASGLGFVAQLSNRRFYGEPPQTPRADSGREPLPCTGSCPRLRLAFLATMRPALDPAGHRVPQAEPTCLSTPQRPRKV
jgi:hypothetical protein